MGIVVILLSDKRSGSTMFQDELCKHSEIMTVDYSPHTYLETHHWLKAAVMLGFDPQLYSGGKVYSGYGSIWGAKEYMIDCIIKNVPDFVIPENDRDLIFEGWEAMCDQFAKPVFFEKSPQILAQWGALSLMLEWMEMTKHKVKVIGLIRNPMAVMYSAWELFHTEPERRQYGWLDIHKNLLAMKAILPEQSYYQVKYEDIIDKPVETFADICRFIGVGSDQNVGKKVHGSSLQKWLHDESFTLQLDDRVKQMAIILGYSEKDLVNPGKVDLSKYKKNIKNIKGKGILIKARLKDRFYHPIRIMLERKRVIF